MESAKTSKRRNKICWITPDYFLAVDNVIVPQLNKYYDIDWILVNTCNTERKSDGLLLDSFKPKEHNLRYRQKDPRVIQQFLTLIKEIRKSNSDLIYISFHGMPYFFPLYFLLSSARNVIYGAHNVSTPKGATHEHLMRLYNEYVYSRIDNYHVFSKSQLNVINRLLPDKNAYYAPLTLPDYGTSDIIPPDGIIRFLFFGYVREYKRLDLLIKAFQDVYNSGIHNIELHIAGHCENWEYYESLITLKSVIKSKIHLIPNKEIPDLISSCHYMVLPYQDIAQSAVLTLAYQYNKPTIVSDIEPFKEFIVDGITGYVFKSLSQDSLASVIKNTILNHDACYASMKLNITELVKKEYSTVQILSKYIAFLDECIIRNCNEKY